LLPEYWKRGGVSLEEISFRWSLFGFPGTKERSESERVSTVNISSFKKFQCSSEKRKVREDLSEFSGEERLKLLMSDG